MKDATIVGGPPGPAPILVAGGTGRLGRRLVERLTGGGHRVRLLSRNPVRARDLQGPRVEVVPGDVRDARAVDQAVGGTQTIISAVHGFAGTGADSPQTVDWQGNRNLIRAAEAHGVGHFILLSIHGAAPDHPLELFRMKYRAEEALRASTLAWTIIRPTAYMETWALLLGEPLLKTGKTTIFGGGNNPVNFISVYDVARFVERAVVDPALRGQVLEVGGPENLTMRQVVHTFETVTGKQGAIRAVPRPWMRLMTVLMRPLNPTLARQIQAGVVMDTQDMTCAVGETRHRDPLIALTSWDEVVRRDYLNGQQD